MASPVIIVLQAIFRLISTLTIFLFNVVEFLLKRAADLICLMCGIAALCSGFRTPQTFAGIAQINSVNKFRE